MAEKLPNLKNKENEKRKFEHYFADNLCAITYYLRIWNLFSTNIRAN